MNKLVKTDDTAQPAPLAPIDVHEVTATSPDEMAEAQQNLIAWFERKVVECESEASDTLATHDYAKKHKWRTEPLKRQADRASKRLMFYQKILAALKAGYVIVPNFPVTAFAIRTSHKKPFKLATLSDTQRHTQKADGAPIGEGEYQNPFPVVAQKTILPATASQEERVRYWATAWKDLEFPIVMANIRIIEATTTAMALKVFDDFAILPGYAPSEGTRPPAGDPIIVARIYNTSIQIPYYHADRKHITFMIAWHLNLATI